MNLRSSTLRVCVLVMDALILAVTAYPARAQEASAVRALIETVIERLFKNASVDAAEQLAEMGGKSAVRELLEKSSAEGGEALVKRVAEYGMAEGPAAIRIIGRSPAVLVKALDGLVPPLRSAALRALERDPEVLTQFAALYGRSALEVAVRHPGVGVSLMEQFGEQGIKVAGNLSNDEAILLARHASEIKSLAPLERANVLETVGKIPGRVLTYLEEHPKVLLTGAGVTTVIALKDELIGTPGLIIQGADGKKTQLPAGSGVVERVISVMLTPLARPLYLIATIIAGGIAGWVLIRLWGSWRRQQLRTAIIAAQVCIASAAEVVAKQDGSLHK